MHGRYGTKGCVSKPDSFKKDWTMEEFSGNARLAAP
jgi:hypothetical protein